MSIDLGHVSGHPERRVERLKQAMEKGGLNLLLLTSEHSIMYVSESKDVAYSGNAVLIRGQGDPIFVAAETHAGRLPFECWIRDVRYWHGPFIGLTPISFEDKVVEVVKETKLEKARIGYESDSVAYKCMKKWLEALPGAVFVDAEDLVKDVMAIKDDEEIALLKQVAAITDVAMLAFMREFKVGMKECEVAGIVEHAMRNAGTNFFYGATQVNSCAEVACDHVPSEKIIQPGTILKLDVHPSFKGYRGDCLRSFSLGTPAEPVKQMAKAVKDVAAAMLEMMVPGVSVKDFAKRARSIVEKAGYQHYPHHELGHHLGTGHLRFFTDSLEETFQDNMVVIGNAHVTEQGVQTVKLEFAVWIKESGPELLQKSTPLDLVVLDV